MLWVAFYVLRSVHEFDIIEATVQPIAQIKGGFYEKNSVTRINHGDDYRINACGEFLFK